MILDKKLLNHIYLSLNNNNSCILILARTNNVMICCHLFTLHYSISMRDLRFWTIILHRYVFQPQGFLIEHSGTLKKNSKSIIQTY